MAVRYSKRTNLTICGKKKIGTVPGSLGRKRFSSFINLPCYGVPQNYLYSDGPSALFLVKERLIAGYLKKGG